MSEYEKDVKKYVDSGEFFEDARDWYNVKYHWPVSERAFFIVITAMAVFSIGCVLFALSSYMPLKIETSFPIRVENTGENLYTLNKIVEGREDSNTAIKKFLVRDYVTSREAYSAKEMESNFKRVRRLSSEEVYQDYRRFMDSKNPDSPIARFGRHTVRKVRLLGHKLYERGELETEYRATVVFAARAVGREQSSWKRWRADIRFVYDDIVVDEETGKKSPLEFYVTDYKVKPYRGE